MKWKEHIRIGETEDFRRLTWSWPDYPITQKVYQENITKGLHSFLVAEVESRLVGELHMVWESVDQDEANGLDRVYLCAFRVHPDYRNKGLGKALIERAVEHAKERGYKEASIGVEKNEDGLKSMYNRRGFVHSIKKKSTDHHNFESGGKYKKMENPVEILVKELANPDV